LNSLDRFWVNAAAPVLLNVCMIAAVLLFRGTTPLETSYTQAIAVTLSGVMQLLWLIWSCQRAGVVLRLGFPRLTPAVKRLLVLIFPAALGAGAIQFNLLISTSLAARFLPQGAVSYLYYADRLNQLPLGLIGIGVGTAILPALSRQIGSGNEQAARDTQNRAIELALFLALPAAVALCIAATPLIRGLLQHGVFTANDTTGAAAALAAFSVGVPAYVLIKVLTPGFYARQDTRTPVRVALFSMLFNLVGNLILIWPLGHVGVAVSTAIAAWVNVLILYWLLHKRDQLKMDARLKYRGVRIIIASAMMGAALWFLGPLLDPYMASDVIERVFALILLCGAGGLVYVVAIFAFGAYRLSELRSLMTRPKQAS
jgi:putative peptidoglycan lipid II flippase